MKISLFFKPYMIKAYSFLVILPILAGIPSSANASFFSDITASVFGQAQAEDSGASLSDNNSQNVGILETGSVNPDLKNAQLPSDPIIGQDGSVIYNDDLSETDTGASLNLEKSPISDQISVYTVKEGDTLSGIADLFDVSTNTIRWENNISGKTISVGQKLNILPMTGIKHIVKSGDTVSKIADKYDADVEDVMIFNGIEKGDGLKKGDIVFVPNGIIKPIVVVKTKLSSGSSDNSTAYSNTKAPTGYYLRPVPGRITSPYGSRRGGFHPGVDLAGTEGVTPVMAAADGVVSEVVSGCVVGKRHCGGGYGNHIEIEHPNGTKTRYAHLSRTSVSLGQSVSQGDKIGVLGDTGSSTGPHLHFEVMNANGSKMRPPV